MSPIKYKKRIMISYGVFYLVGIDIFSYFYLLFEYFITYNEYREDIGKLFFIIPVIISSLQALLCILFFNKNTPIELCRDALKSQALSVLSSIYSINEFCIEEYNKIEEQVNKSENLSYITIFFRSKYLLYIINGNIIMMLRVSCEVYIPLEFNLELSEKKNFIAILIYLPFMFTALGCLTYTYLKSG